MAVASWLVTKTDNGPIINGIVNVLMNSDGAGTEGDTLAEAQTSVIAAGHPIPPAYFNTAVVFLTAYPTDLDAVIMTHRGSTVYEA